MRDFDEGAVTDVNIRIGEETIPEKQTVRYLGAFFGAQDILPGSPFIIINIFVVYVVPCCVVCSDALPLSSVSCVC